MTPTMSAGASAVTFPSTVACAITAPFTSRSAMPSSPPIETSALRQVLGRFATGVAVVSAAGIDGRPLGLTINSFASVSLEPPLVLWSIRKDAKLHDAFVHAGHWAVSVLHADQFELARRFSSPIIDRFEGVEHAGGLGGAPILSGAIASIECSRWQAMGGGDHTILVGQVERCVSSEGPPLLFHGGNFGHWLPRQ